MTIVCSVCELGKSKYKCPECLISYCSLVCWKNHKSSVCKPVAYKRSRHVDLHAGSAEDLSESIEDAVPIEKLQQLDHSEELHQVLTNPHLRDMLMAIDKSERPSQAIQAAMVEPIFLEFADICLRIVEPNKEAKREDQI